MATQVYEDPQGNLMEEDPMQQRFRPGIDDVGPIDAADAAAEQADATAKAAQSIEAGQPAVTHESRPGADNLRKLYGWRKEGEE